MLLSQSGRASSVKIPSLPFCVLTVTHPTPKTPDVQALDSLTGGAFAAQTSGERAAKLRMSMAAAPSDKEGRIHPNRLLHELQQRLAPDAVVVAQQGDLRQMPWRFLVVDDHPLNRLLVRQILKNNWKNCDIVEADNGVKALDAMRQHVFDVILMDMVMPDMDGIEAVAALRTTFEPPMCDTPVLGLTANVNPVDLERFTAAGVNALLLKPFDAMKVCAQVEEMLKAKKSFQGS